jgi:tetratricopeptide (TPR) repeat protein
MNRLIPVLAAALLAVHAAPAALAADSAAEPVVSDPLGKARALIADHKWRAAIDELERVGARNDADWNNLMGYSHRRAKVPDYAAAERYYDKALALNPRHRGALEYSGELYLMIGDLARAEQRLAALDGACAAACEEHAALKKAIADFKANGNRVAAQN